MATELIIDEGSSEFTIQENGKYDLEIRNTFTDDGQADLQELLIEIEGNIVDEPAGKVYDRIKDLVNSSSTFAAVRVRIKVDGVFKFDFKPEESILGPFITRFRTITDDGAGDGHWRYGLSIWSKSKSGRGKDNKGAIQLEQSITTVRVNDRLTRKIWRCDATSSSLARARQIVLNFKPTVKIKQEELQEFFTQNRVAGTWVWSYDQELMIEERIKITGAGATYDSSPRLPEDPNARVFPDPMIYRMPNPAQRVVLTGTLRSTKKDKIEVPPPHWAETGNLKRQLGMEEIQPGPLIYDVVSGHYIQEYQEVYIAVGGVPDPNHGKHSAIPKLQEPAD